MEEWWEQERKREEEKVKRSTFNERYKEIMPEGEGCSYLNNKRVKREDRVTWARMRCGSIGRAGKKGENDWRCRICGRENEILAHLISCEEAMREQDENTKREVRRWKGEKGEGEINALITRELRGEVNTTLCKYMRKIEERIRQGGEAGE